MKVVAPETVGLSRARFRIVTQRDPHACARRPHRVCWMSGKQHEGAAGRAGGPARGGAGHREARPRWGTDGTVSQAP